MVWIAKLWKNHGKTMVKPWFYNVFCTLWVLGMVGWGILVTVLGDVGSKRMIFCGSWGYVVTFWWQASA